ncbi:hypothetical protein MD484_g5109, partial [Candolleomyces efflorescens]
MLLLGPYADGVIPDPGLSEQSKTPLVEKLATFQSEKSHLCHQILSNSHKGYHIKEWAKEIIQHDVVHIGALVLQCLSTEEGREAFLREKELPSTDQNLVDLVQGTFLSSAQCITYCFVHS